MRSKVNSFDDLFKREVTFGASGTGGMLAQHPFVFRNLLGAKVKVVMGYKGTNEVNIAMERGEVDGACATVRLDAADALEGRVGRGPAQGHHPDGHPENHPAFGDAPNILNYAKTDEDRQVMHAHLWPVGDGASDLRAARHPGRPPRRTAQGDDGHAEGPGLRRGSRRSSRMETNPATAAEVEKLLADFASYPPDVIAKAKAAIGN